MKLNVKIFKKLLYSTLISGVIFSTVSHAQGLLDKVKVEEKKSLSLQIYDDILAPILNYDENAVTVKVLDDLSIFEGVNDYYRTENSNNYYKVPNPNFTGDFFPTQYDSDRDIYRVLGAKPEELLLKINVEVRLTPEYINKIETFLKENTQHN